MNCINCEASMTSAKEDVVYYLDLPYEITLHGVTVLRCPECGEEEVAIEQVESLHRAIALSVARREGRLHPKEIRFLRKSMDWTGRAFAEHLQVAPETVSRWETGAKKMGERSELLLRMFIELGDRLGDYTISDEKGLPSEMRMTPDSKAGWSVAA